VSYTGTRTVDPISGLELPSDVELRHLSPTIGTEVFGVDLRHELPTEIVAFLRAAWLERKVIFFRDQRLTEEQHIRFGRCFGELEQFPPTAENSKPGYPELVVFRRGTDNTQRENFLHQDVPFKDPPVDGTIALLRVCPEIGGDTIFVDMAAAYDGMSDWLKRAVEGMEAMHRFDTAIALYHTTIDQELVDRMMAKFPPKAHPVVQTHPETGRRLLYVSPGYTHSIVGVPREESAALVKLLSDQARTPEYQCRFRWEENSIAFWDNRAVQHYACFDYEGQRRELDRVVVLGGRSWTQAP
jgi:taurine dioxygenase